MAGLLTPQRQTAGNGLLDQAPRRVDDRVAGLLGLDPSIQRGAILPFGRDASGEMVMAWPEMAIDTLKSLMLPGHVMQGGEFTPRDVTEMALDLGMLSTVAPAPAGAKRMFGGISAKNAPLDDLAKAEAMEKAGEAADDIWRATGWGRGADQKWRFEIDDSGADFRDLATRPVEQYGVFGRAQEKFRHPELFGAYDLPYEIDAGRGSRRHGSASAPTHWRSDMPDRGIKAGDIQDMGRVTAKGGTRGEIKQTALHEFQHAVQNAEGFARGGNMSDEAARLAAQREAEIMATAEAALSPADQASLARYRDLATRHRGADVIPGDVVIEVNDMKKAPWFRQFQENIDEIRKMRAQAGGGAGALESGLIDREEAFRQYERLAGEVEARNVERRMDMDAATRRATPPWSTEDVPRDQQIVRGLLSGDGPQMSASLPMDEASGVVHLTDDAAAKLSPVERAEVARRNAAQPVDAGGLGLPDANTADMRQAAMGYDADAYHVTRATEPFSHFRPGMWDATYLAATPRRAEAGAMGGAQELAHLSAPPDAAATSSKAIMPLRVRGDDIATLRPSRSAWDALPETAPEDEISELARGVGGNHWWDVYEEVQIKEPKWNKSGDLVDPGKFEYRKRPYPAQPYTARAKPWQDSESVLPGYNSGSDGPSLRLAAAGGQHGFIVSDEAGASIVAGQSMPIRSRFAAFDPARRDSTDILASYLGVPGIGMLDAMPQDDQSRERRGLLNN